MMYEPVRIGHVFLMPIKHILLLLQALALAENYYQQGIQNWDQLQIFLISLLFWAQLLVSQTSAGTGGCMLRFRHRLLVIQGRQNKSALTKKVPHREVVPKKKAR